MFGIYQLSVALAAFSTLVHSAAIERRATALDVTLSEVGHGLVKAAVKNTGATDLNLLTFGNFFDSAPVQKLSVSNDKSTAAFTGVLRSVQYSNLTAESFYLLAAGATFETTINTAAVHELSTGNYTAVAEGAIPYAPAGSTALTGAAVSFKSNAVTLKIDGALARLVPRAVQPLEERTVLQSGCSAAQLGTTQLGLLNCAALARAASTAASSGSAAKFAEYFKTSSRAIVAARFSAVAAQCASSTTGATKYYCTDVYHYCRSNVLAYTLPSANIIVNCPLYYSVLPALTGTCHKQDQATTTLHEMTHAPAVYAPGTVDNGYGYAAVAALSANLALNNADSYAMYANAIHAGC